MKKTKKWLVSALMIAFSATSAFAITSCKKGGDDSSPDAGSHTHTYTDTVTAPTCTTDGYTTHTCECGDSYVDAQIPAFGHKYNTNVTKYPTVTEAGEKIVTCKTCGVSETQTISAMTATLPKVSEVLVAMIGAMDVSIALDEGTHTFYTQAYEVPMEGAEKRTVTVEFALAEVAMDTANGLTAHMGIEVTAIEAYLDDQGSEIQSETIGGEINCYVNGDDVSLEVVSFEGTTTISQQVNMSELLYNAIAEATGLTYDQLVTMTYVSGELMNYLPNVMTMVAGEMPMVSESYVQSLDALFQLVGQDIITTTQDGTNTAYAIDMTALAHFVDEIDGETISTYFDKVYGAGSMAALTEFAVGLPAMTIKDVANSAIAIAETYGIDVGNVYYLVNILARQMGADGFDVETVIEQYYDITLGSMIISASGSEELTVEGMQTMIADMFAMYVDLTINDIYTMSTGEEIDFIEQVRATINMLPDMVAANAVFDENGALVEANLLCGEFNMTISVDGANVTATTTMNGMDVEFAIGETGVLYTVSMDDAILTNIAFLFDENNCGADVMINGTDCFDFSASYDNGTATVSVGLYGMEGGYHETYYDEDLGETVYIYIEREVVKKAEIDVTATLVEGTVTAATGTIDAWNTVRDTEGEYVETWGQVANFTYANDNGNVTAAMEIENETYISLTNAKTEDSNVFTMVVTDTKAGPDNTDTEVLGEMVFGYEMVEDKTNYFINQINFNDGEEEPMFNIEVMVENGMVVSYVFGYANDFSANAAYSGEYEEEGVLYQDVDEVDPNEWIEFTYTATENNALWTIRTTYTEINRKYTQYYNATLDKWFVVKDSMQESSVTDTHGYDISASVVEGVMTFRFTPVGEGGFGSTYIMNEIELIISESGMKYIVYGADVDDDVNYIEIKNIDNGFEFVVAAPDAGLDATLTFTYVDGVFHIGYDLEEVGFGMGNSFSGEGGLSISIS